MGIVFSLRTKKTNSFQFKTIFKTQFKHTTYILNIIKLLTFYMSPKKIEKKKILSLKNFQSIVTKNLTLNKFKVNPTNVIEGTKNKIGNFYNNLKKEREKKKKKD